MDDNKGIIINSPTLFKIYFIINFLMFLGIAIIILFLFINPYLLRGKNINKYSNDYCNNENNIYYDLLCTNTYFNYKKSKFIWITIDGMATDQLVDLHNLDKYGITTKFLNLGDYNKYTNMLYEAMMTGKYNSNLPGAIIRYDNIIKQLIEAKYNISFIGWKYPIIGLIGDDLANKFYAKNIDNKREISTFYSFCNITNIYPFLLRDFVKYQAYDPKKVININLVEKIIDLINKVRDSDYYLLRNVTKKYFFDELDEIMSEEPDILLELNITECLINNFKWNNEDNISIIYYSTELDEYNHYYGKNHIYSLLQAYIVEKMIIQIMKWVDEHKDYVLIFNSDHGGQHFYGEDTIRNHGEDFPGNEGIFYIYTNDFKINYEKLKMNERYINILDESVLMSQILYNINIPLESNGIPYPLINDEIFEYSCLKRKEIQLIKIINLYDTEGKNNEFQKILKELNESLEQIKEIKDKFFDKLDDISLKKELKLINKNNLDILINQQNKINEIISKNNHTKTNIAITIIIIIVIIIKSSFECFYMLKLLLKQYFNFHSQKQKIFLILFFVFYSFLIEFIFSFFSYASFKLQLFIQLYIFITCIILIILKIFASYENTSNINLDKKIYYYFLLISGYLFFQIFSEYSYSFNRIKSFFSRYKPQLLLNIFFLYPLLIIFTINEIKKYKFEKTKKGEYAFLYMIILMFVFIIVIFIEDLSYNNYYAQNTLNSISMYIGIMIYLIYFISCFILNSFDLIKIDNKKLIILNKLELNASDVQINNINNNNNSKDISLNKIDNKTTEDIIIKNKTNSSYYYYNNFIFLKLCIIHGTFWLSEESEKIYIFLSLIFFEFSEFMNNFIYKAIFTIKNDIDIDKDNQLIKNKNFSLIIYIFYIIIQKTIIIMNQLFYILIIHSYDLNTARQQQEKFIRISGSLGIIFSYVSNFKFSFITLAYYFEKIFFETKNNKKIINFSIFFILKKIIVNLRLNNSTVLIIFHLLIKKKAEQTLDFYSYYLEDLIFFFFDHFFIVVYLIIFKIIN